jgi:uncharacterized membrane protein YkgB
MANVVKEYARTTSLAEQMFVFMAGLKPTAITILRCGLVLVLVWIGGLKFANYEADSIVPLMANSPAMSFVYVHPAPEYRSYMNKEGELVPAHRAWHQGNRTYPVSHALGVVIVTLGFMIALHKPLPQIAAFGSALLIGMSCVTLSFLITTPEAWVQATGDGIHGFPYLSGVGRLIIKDSIMFGAAFVTMADSATAYVQRRGWSATPSNSKI